MPEQNNSGKKKEPRQEWKPHWLPDSVRLILKAALGVVKIAAGAVATVALICVVCAFVFVGILGTYLEEDILPDAQIVKENYDADEKTMLHYVDADGDIQDLQEIYAATDRDWAYYDEIPEALIQAAVAIEDKRFYEHQGVDWITTVKACAGMFFGTSDAGGSTITQQLVKNLTGDNSVTVRRKVVEIFKAQDFERRYDKKVIMEWYLNMIYFGDRRHGVKSAAAHYFGKELQELTVAECASLISITNNPSIFGPYSSAFEYNGEMMTGAERNRIRQVNTLWEMRNQGYLTDEEYEAARDQELVFKSGIADEDRLATCEQPECGYQCTVKELVQKEDGLYYCPECGSQVKVGDNASQAVYSWFVDTVLEDVASVLAARDGFLWKDLSTLEREMYRQLIQRGGYHVYTTLDKTVQDQVDKIYTDLEQIPQTLGAQQLQSGIVVVDNRTGDIVGMAGGVGEKVVFDAFNMATDAQRQVGSSFKPLAVYAPAFESGKVTPATVILDMPLWYTDNRPYPRNESYVYNYSMTVLDGVVNSINAVSVNTLDIIGTRYSFDFAKEKFRISGLVESDGQGNTDVSYSPLSMGGLTIGATVRDVTSAYATFANGGVWREGRTYTKVYDSQGDLVIENEQDQEQILSQKTVDYMNYCLSEAVKRGTGTVAQISGMEVYGKTGTTTSLKDRYFCGFTGYYTAAVWCGFEQPAQITLTGPDRSNPAARLWKKVMEPLHEGKESVRLYDKDDKMVSVTVCLESGGLVSAACQHDIRGSARTSTVKVYPEDVPNFYCDRHILVDYCTEGKAVANEYCKKFAAVGMLKLEQTALVTMTQEQIDSLRLAGECGLVSHYLQDEYIYQVDDNGDPVSFHGIYGDRTGTGPCVSCTVHTKEAWEEYVQENPWVQDP